MNSEHVAAVMQLIAMCVMGAIAIEVWYRAKA
jgi:hypothetical protein